MAEDKKTTPPPPPSPAKAAPALDDGRIDRVTRIFCAIVDGPNHAHFIEQAIKIENDIAEAVG